MTVRTALVVDDDDMIREVAQVALEVVGGWNVLTADGGGAGLTQAKAHLPDVILLDVMMPDLDGIETFELLREDPTTRDIPVILVTAKHRVDGNQLWDGLPIAGVIPKPFDPMTLAADVSRLLGWTS